MADQIYQIPINEAFGRNDGCPLCFLASDLEHKSLEYVMGPAMMDPEIRKRTNAAGFCGRHLGLMEQMKNKLSLALVLQSHLEQMARIYTETEKPSFSFRDSPSRIREMADACFICGRVRDFETKYIENIIYLWKQRTDFRTSFSNQPYFCPEHSSRMLEAGAQLLSTGVYKQFKSSVIEVQLSYIKALHNDLRAFCESFDHAKSAIPLSDTQRTAVQRVIAFLSGWR